MTRHDITPERKPALGRVAAAALLAAVAVGVALWTFGRVNVCDTVTGPKPEDMVTTCRHLQLTDPPALAVGVLLLIALALVADLHEVVVLGIGVKRNLADAKAAADSAEAAAGSAERAQEGAQGAAVSAGQAQSGAEAAVRDANAASDSASMAAEHARGAADSAARTEELVQAFQRIQASGGVGLAAGEPDVEERARALAARYVEIRSASPGFSPQRTRDMTDVVAEMIATFSPVGPERGRFSLNWLDDHDDAGRRLAAYAYLYTHPDAALTEPLARSALNDDRPFTQYWALRALRRIVEGRADLDRYTRRDLEALLKDLGPHTDRGHELVEILRLTDIPSR